MTSAIARFSPHLVIALTGLISYVFIASSLLLLVLTVAVVVGSILLGSVSKFASALVLFVLFISSLTLIHNILLPGTYQIFRNNFVLFFGLLGTLFLVSRIRSVKVGWKDDLAAVCISGSVLLLLVSKKLFATGAAIAALFTNEDNAAWVSNAASVSNGANQDPGIFGPLIDNTLYLTQLVASFTFPNLENPDHAALSVVLLGILFLALIPFISVTLMSWINGFDDNITLSSQLLSIGLIFASANFLFFGHLTAALSLVALVTGTILATRVSEIEGLRAIHIIVITLIFAVMSETWFPVSPLFILLGFYLIYFFSIRSASLTIKEKAILAASVAILALSIWHTLITRFVLFSDTTESSIGGAINGASSLLTIEGGVVGIGPLSMTVAILLSLLVLALNSVRRHDITRLMIPIAIGIIFSVALRAINIFVTQGSVNYGSRKMDTFIALAVIVYATWLLVYTHEKSEASKLSVMTVWALSFALVSQVPSVDTLLARNAFSGMSNDLNLKIGRAISDTAVVGKNLVCFTASSDPYPNDKRFLAYKCSRFSSAYTLTDNATANGWRLAMLGQNGSTSFSQISAEFPSDTSALFIDSTKAQLEEASDSDWHNLIGKDWEVVEIGE